MPVRDRIDLRRRLAEIAGTQAGYFTAAQALDAGYSYSAQRYHVHRGNWEQVDRALFRIPEWPPSATEHLVRWALWSKERAVVSHETALALYGLGDVSPPRVHLTVPPGFRQKAPSVILHVADLPDDDIRDHEGYRVTTPLRSVLDAAAGTLHPDELVKVIDEGIRAGLFTEKTLRSRVDEFGPEAALRVERALAELRNR
jgi:hypothetical protein